MQLLEAFKEFQEQFNRQQLRDHDTQLMLAGDTVEKLDVILVHTAEKRETLAAQRAKAKNPNELLLIDMMDDMLIAREDQARTDRDNAKLAKSKAEVAVKESLTNIKKIPSTAAFPSWGWVREKWVNDVGKTAFLLITFEFIRSVLLPFLTNGVLPFLTRVFAP